MYNLDYFSYWKKPIVKINHIGIYPLDDEGKVQYYAKDSFITHKYLRKADPSIFNKIISETEANEENTLNQNNNESNMNTLSENKKYESLKTEPNQETLNPQNNVPSNNTISSTSLKNRMLNQRYNGNSNYRKKLRPKLLNSLHYKSYSKDRKTLDGNEIEKRNDDFGKTFNEGGRKKMTQSFDKSAHLTGLPVFKDGKARVNQKLPLIMGRFNNRNTQLIKTIRTGSKEMGENYNPYNFICPHVNRTKRNYVGGLFHC